MLHELQTNTFFLPEERTQLTALGIDSTSDRRSLGAILLASQLELCQREGATSSAEFEILEDFLHRLEYDLEIVGDGELDTIGTAMGLVPVIASSWKANQFVQTRAILAQALGRLPESTAHELRQLIATGCLALATASSGHILDIRHLHEDDVPLIRQIVTSFQLDETSEGIELLERTGLI